MGREAQWLAERMDRHREPGDTFEQQYHDGAWIQVREHRLPDGSTSILNLDITAHKHTESELHRQASRYRKAAKIAKFGCWGFNEAENCYEYLAPEYAEILGRSVEDLLANFDGWENDYKLLHPDDRVEWERHDDEWGKCPEDWDVEYRLVCRTVRSAISARSARWSWMRRANWCAPTVPPRT